MTDTSESIKYDEYYPILGKKKVLLTQTEINLKWTEEICRALKATEKTYTFKPHTLGSKNEANQDKDTENSKV